MPLLQLIIDALHMLQLPLAARCGQRRQQTAKLGRDGVTVLHGERFGGFHKAVAPLAVQADPKKRENKLRLRCVRGPSCVTR